MDLHRCMRAVSAERKPGTTKSGGLLNRRRRGSGAVERAERAASDRVVRKTSFVFPADAAVLSVFQDYTRIVQFLAYCVGALEVALLFGGVALFDESFDFFGGEARGGTFVAHALQ